MSFVFWHFVYLPFVPPPFSIKDECDVNVQVTVQLYIMFMLCSAHTFMFNIYNFSRALHTNGIFIREEEAAASPNI